ncbi:MAG: NGG1p interacting factor NIF3 [SAR86 cluster bacterium]|uniref:NGG1p interacting factor NIF3 n=1 Tax=SAR86 cluster bacterium TaxID=2030880 RepID=A0A2A5AHG7_9GAMM|nr:MAG: NGG1p interacting factor NIF3 [SAR86 cluster bacterium]
MSAALLYKIEFYVPESHLETVKSAMFEAGGGKVGNYDCCAWQTLGKGQYRPRQGSQPFLGEQDKLKVIAEYKVEMVCAAENIAKVIEAMMQAHPYEEVAYLVIRNEVLQGGD